MTTFERALRDLPPWFWSTAALGIGAVWGSFLNVVIFRVPRGLSVVTPPSSCPTCKARIRWFDNVPVLSWLILRGRCRRCAAPISQRYPLVELLTALLSWTLMHHFGPRNAYVVNFTFVLLLIALSFIDLDTWLIPDVLSLPGIALGVLGALLLPGQPWLDRALGAAVGGGALWLIAVLARIAMKREGMGMGDVKMLAMIGAFLGVRALFLVVGVASISGVLIGSVWLYLSRNTPPPPPQEDGFVPPKGALPFGPFLTIGALASLFYGEQLLSLLSMRD